MGFNMKILGLSLRNTLCIALFSVLGSLLYSQGNLQFNQVLTFTGSIGVIGPNAVTSPIQTVPAGKVWKIESVGGLASNQSSGNVRFGIQINTGISIVYWNNLIDQNICPIWLKTNDNLQFYYHNPSTNAQTCSYIISVVEFNIIP
jgi:hypothetical protein